MRLTERLAAVPFRRLVWLLPATFALHELEEWNIMVWYREQFTNPPETSDFVVRTLLVGFSLLAVVWTGIGCALPTPRAAACFVLPFFVPFVFANNLQHVYWQLAFGAYAPGVLASTLLNVPAIVLLSWHARRNHLVTGRYVAGLYLLSLPAFLSVARGGRVMSPALLRVHELGGRLVAALFGAA